MDKDTMIRSALLHAQLTGEFRAGQLALMLGEGLLTAEDQRWLAPMFDRKQKAPIRLTFTRKTRGRPGAFPGVADDPLWGAILRELDVDELVRRLEGGTLSAEDQHWLGVLLDSGSDAPIKLTITKTKGGQPDPERVRRLYELGHRVDRLLRRASNQKRIISKMEKRFGYSRKTLLEARKIYLEVEVANTEMWQA
jgi:hypothetical protein